MSYESQIEELLALLEKAGEDHWVQYFKSVQANYRKGRLVASYKAVLAAYGGMGSFNDIQLNFLTEREVARVEAIRSYLWKYCRAKRHWFLRWFLI